MPVMYSRMSVSETPPLSLNKAERQAIEFMREIGDFQIVNSYPSINTAEYNKHGDKKWQFSFARTVNSTKVGAEYDYLDGYTDEFYMPEYKETILVTVDHSGIIGFEWYFPYEVSDSAFDNQGLLPFSNILNITKEQLGTWVANDETLVIQIFELSYSPIKAAYSIDHKDDIELIPTWNLYGTLTDAENNRLNHKDFVFLSINGVTGEVFPSNFIRS